MNITKLMLLPVLLLITSVADAQLYSKAYGDNNNPAIIFLHGGPGYNSFTFEASTAERLAEEGYYVIVFDQRGCGRSETEGDDYTFEEAITDIDGIYKKYNVDKASLIGHSWGGGLAIVYAEAHPDMVNDIVLVGAPMDYQQTFKAILVHARASYEKNSKQAQLSYLDILDTMDNTSLAYANYCFMHAMSSGQYSTNDPAENVKDIAVKMQQHPDIRQAMNMTQPPVKGFYDSEHYTTLTFYDRLSELKEEVPVYGIYGKDDGLFDEEQLNNISRIVGSENFTVVEGASHSVFIDQQEEFIKLLTRYTEK